jgi:hypothetical protein
MKRYAVAAIALALLVFPAVAGAGKIVYTNTLPKNGSRQITVKVTKPAAFRVLMRTSTQGRTRLYLLGAHAPKGGPLIDTKTYRCEGAAGSRYCKGAYEPLPAGTYTFRVVFTSTVPTNPGGLSLTVSW